jgi:hypothetical protein
MIGTTLADMGFTGAAISRRIRIRSLSMSVKFAATMNAVNKGLDEMDAAIGADLIEDWETALADVDVPGAKGIGRDLGALRKQLEKGQPDSARVLALVHRLGEATSKIAEKSDKQSDKLKALGEALSEAGDEDQDDPEDSEAAATPKRRAGRPAKK